MKPVVKNVEEPEQILEMGHLDPAQAHIGATMPLTTIFENSPAKMTTVKVRTQQQRDSTDCSLLPLHVQQLCATNETSHHHHQAKEPCGEHLGLHEKGRNVLSAV